MSDDSSSLNHPNLSALEIADSIEDALDYSTPVSSSVLEDAMTHIRILSRKLQELERKSE